MFTAQRFSTLSRFVPRRGHGGNAAPFLIGKATSYGYFNGDLDEIALYPHVLSAARVGAHFSAAHGSH